MNSSALANYYWLIGSSACDVSRDATVYLSSVYLQEVNIRIY